MGFVFELKRFTNYREFDEFLYDEELKRSGCKEINKHSSYLFSGAVACPGAKPIDVAVPYTTLKRMASAVFDAGYHIVVDEILDGYRDLEFRAEEPEKESC